MATTTNYSWTTPDDTALVKDGAAAIRSLGTAIDTTVFNNAGAAIQKSVVDAKGDIIAATAADTVARLAVGANNTILTADSSTATGLKWAAPGGAGANWSLLNAGGTTLSGSTTTVSGITGADKILIIINDVTLAASLSYIGIRFNTDTGNNYNSVGQSIKANSGYSADNFATIDSLSNNNILFARTSNSNANSLEGYLLMSGCNSAGLKVFNGLGAPSTNDTEKMSFNLGGFYDSSSTISSISIICVSATTFSGGKVFVYTSA